MASSTPRRRLVGVSTKMYFSAARTKQYVSAVLSQLQAAADVLTKIDVFIIPDHLTLASVVTQIESSSHKLLVGAQDTFWEDTGAYTGEVSPAVLSELGCRIVELGHAERRRIFSETDADVTKKAQAVARNNMIPLVCIGERTRSSVLSQAVGECATQIDAVLKALPSDKEVILAYEPVWAIGASEPASADHVLGVVASLRALPSVQAREEGKTRIIYGGSAGPGLFDKLKGDVDGLFLGRFAHEPEAFVKTIREVAEAS